MITVEDIKVPNSMQSRRTGRDSKKEEERDDKQIMFGRELLGSPEKLAEIIFEGNGDHRSAGKYGAIGVLTR